jgi:toxin HigB-1
MIKPYRHKGLKLYYETGNHRGINPDHVKRFWVILARLDASATHENINLPGLRLHPLQGDLEGFWEVTVSGN